MIWVRCRLLIIAGQHAVLADLLAAWSEMIRMGILPGSLTKSKNYIIKTVLEDYQELSCDFFDVINDGCLVL